jgi:6-phosphogluconate dehydrogenase
MMENSMPEINGTEPTEIGSNGMREKAYGFGLLGLAVMGGNFALNIADHGFSVGVYNRTKSKTRKFMEDEAKGRAIGPAFSLGNSRVC